MLMSCVLAGDEGRPKLRALRGEKLNHILATGHFVLIAIHGSKQLNKFMRGKKEFRESMPRNEVVGRVGICESYLIYMGKGVLQKSRMRGFLNLYCFPEAQGLSQFQHCQIINCLL